MVSMDLSASITLLLTISCCLWNTESRTYSSVLSVPNGSSWGEWGPISFCSSGYANAFSLKVEKDNWTLDNTGLNGIRLYCDDGTEIESRVGPWGTWTRNLFCNKSYLVSYSLRVEPRKGILDDTAVNNIKFKCSDGVGRRGFGTTLGKFGPWSQSCQSNGICGMRTRMEDAQGLGDDTALNDVVFYCC
ncbi:vitelline membrane outer layer protein 1-like [Pantherophis guttatus]|uniref:Vitelline membrane outer layer protein 1-like n=1 Tax=Pantherophis guttatus TaxID=94885 RepID=A0ABM3Z189_PANGU|nr:vitelline membrane outer layer protein 1-like [Pantherophis guttatus]